MSQSLSMNLVHLTFSTKYRKPLLTESVRPKLFAYQAGVMRNNDCPALVIGGVSDHVHLLFILSRKRTLSDVVEEVKTSSSKWIKTQDESLGEFHWQNGYGAFSVSQSHVPRLRRYIERQEAHHRKMTFQDEFRQLLVRHGIEFDERYVWD